MAEFVRNESAMMRKEAVVVRYSLQPKQTTKYLGKGNRPAGEFCNQDLRNKMQKCNHINSMLLHVLDYLNTQEYFCTNHSTPKVSHSANLWNNAWEAFMIRIVFMPLKSKV